MSDKGLVSKMFKEYRKFKNKLITQLKNGGRGEQTSQQKH